MKKQRDFKKILYSNNVAGYVFSLPFIVGFLGFTLIPILVSMYYSFTDYKLGQELSFIGLKNYIDLFADERFMNSMKVTVIYVVISVPVKLAFALLVAYFLTKKRKGVTLYRSLYYVPSLNGKQFFQEEDLLMQYLLVLDLTKYHGWVIRKLQWEF